jgi:amino acid adenylation domain-containing protein
VVLTNTKMTLFENRSQKLSNREACKFVYRVFESRAEYFPSKIAVEFEDCRLTYSELNQKANSLARQLIKAGLRPTTPVGICLQPGPAMVAAILATLKAGGTYVPISPSYPPYRIDYILNDSRAPFLLTQSHLLAKIGESPVKKIVLDDIFESDGDQAVVNLDYTPEPKQAAYILYTSGSSGNPKGVVISHQSLAYYLEWHCRDLREDIGQVDLPLTASMCFAAGVTQFYAPLLLGRTLHILREDTVRQPERLFSWYSNHPEYGLYCVPALWDELLTYAENQQKGGLDIKGPGCVLLSGEAVSKRLIDRSFEIFPGIKLWNLYGPTETVANGSAGQLNAGQTITLGKPLRGTKIYLVNEEFQRVAPGEEGEICICGDGVASGYLNLPELTQERFLYDPFAPEQKKRLFRTGDLAKYNERGELIYIGRKDFQVKIRGFRVECGEIEKALLEHDSIRQTVVIAHDGAGAERQLVAYILFYFSRYASVDEIRAFLAERLPDYMIPAAFVVLETFPQLANGKIDRSKLPPPGNARPDLGYAFVRPENQREKQVVQIWEQVLGLEGIGINDNFFDLGGNSLKIAAAISRIRETLLIDVTFRDFFASPTPAAMVLTFKELERIDEKSVAAIEKTSRQLSYACTVNQQSLWLLAQTIPELNAYNMQFSLRFGGVLEFDALVKSLKEILRRHDALRSVFKVKDDLPVLEIADFTEPVVEVVNLQHLEIAAGEKEARRLSAKECRHAFDLNKGPLYRFKLFSLADDKHLLYITVHHIVFDGRSIGVFTRELSENYRIFKSGRQPKASAPDIQYQDYAAWQKQQLSGENYIRLLEFWERNLEDSPSRLDFPTDFIRPSMQTFEGNFSKTRLGVNLKERLADFSQREQVTPFMTLLAVFYVLLYRYSGQADIVVGCPVANRNHSVLETLIGYFANVIPLRAKLTPEQSFRELLAAVRQNCHQTFEHSSLPFAKLVEALQPEKSLSYTPVFQVMFAYHEKLFSGQIDSQLRLDAYEDGNKAAKFDFAMDIQEMADGSEIRLTYNTDLYAASTIERFLEQYTELLADVLAEPEKSIVEHGLISEAGRRQLLVDWNATAFDNPREIGLHRLFEEQVSKTPERIALICGDEQMSYDILNRRSNQLAEYLIARGIKSGTTVGVHMERSAEMIVALLAILKSGAAYLPLDPFYPKERIAYIIEDSAVPMILTQQKLAQQLPASQSVVIALDSERQKLDAYGDENPVAGIIAPETLMYLMYTSGSTGNPKGVMLPHKGPCNYVLWMRERFPLSADNKVLSKTSINFDISVWEIFLPLISGAQLVVGRDKELQASENLAALIREQQITDVQFVPSALKAFIDSGLLSSCDSLKRIFSGGESLSVRLQEEVFEEFSGELHNLYGPTEAAVYVCHHDCRPNQRLRSVPIGRPIHNSKIYILDTQMNPVPVGITGELYIGGEILAKGYLNKPEVTSEKFVPDPFADTPGAKMFKTGDLARYLSNGEIEFRGRMDSQVKVRGYRVELGEIEHSLNRHPNVQHAIAIVREDEENDVRVVAYLLYRDKKGPGNSELRDYLKQKLPDYMIPSSFVKLDSIPLLPNNKINIKALPKPEFKKNLDADLERIYSDNYEKILARIWEEVLGTEKFGPSDNFFDVGGHSLLIVKLRSQIKDRMGIELSNIELFQYANIRSLARHLAAKEQSVSRVVSDMARRSAMGNGRLKPRTK